MKASGMLYKAVDVDPKPKLLQEVSRRSYASWDVIGPMAVLHRSPNRCKPKASTLDT